MTTVVHWNVREIRSHIGILYGIELSCFVLHHTTHSHIHSAHMKVPYFYAISYTSYILSYLASAYVDLPTYILPYLHIIRMSHVYVYYPTYIIPYLYTTLPIHRIHVRTQACLGIRIYDRTTTIFFSLYFNFWGFDTHTLKLPYLYHN